MQPIFAYAWIKIKKIIDPLFFLFFLGQEERFSRVSSIEQNELLHEKREKVFEYRA